MVKNSFCTVSHMLYIAPSRVYRVGHALLFQLAAAATVVFPAVASAASAEAVSNFAFASASAAATIRISDRLYRST